MRRVHQVTGAFAQAGWDVDILFRAAPGAANGGRLRITELSRGGVTVRHIEVEGPGMEHGGPGRLPPLRMAATAWHAVVDGDRSGRWAHAAAEVLTRSDAIPRPSAVIGFFTPRGPLAVARYAHRLWNVPWIADLQDPITEGTDLVLRPAVVRWMRHTLRGASRVVQVSPEWAQITSRRIGRRVDVLRHAVPERSSIGGGVRVIEDARGEASTYTLLYAGSINAGYQNPGPLVRAVCQVDAEQRRAGGRRLMLRLACTEEVYRSFAEHVIPGVEGVLRWLGWLDEDALQGEMSRADVLVLVPWSGAARSVVPSKMFEYLAYQRPILVAGTDSGGVRLLLRELGHPDVVADTEERIAEALRAAIRDRTNGLLEIGQCAQPPLTVRELGDRYVGWMEELIRC